MKFFCEYCGCRIDATVDDKCPNCGASYKKNATFIKLEKEQNEKMDKINEVQNEMLNHVSRTFKVSKVVFIIPVIIFIFIIITTVSIFIRTQKNYDNKTSIINDNIDNTPEEIKIEPVTVSGLNVYGEISDYRVKVTGYEDVEKRYSDLQEGYKYVKFYLEVENLTDKSIGSMNVNCIVNGVAQTNERSSGYSTIPFSISKGLTVKGDATFEVPIDATSYDIRYGDYITIHIEK